MANFEELRKLGILQDEIKKKRMSKGKPHKITERGEESENLVMKKEAGNLVQPLEEQAMEGLPDAGPSAKDAESVNAGSTEGLPQAGSGTNATVAGLDAVAKASGGGGGSPLTSMASMAGSGAMIGSAIAPGVGTAIGAGVGATVGLVSGIGQARSARKKRKAAAEAAALAAISDIHANSGKERLAAFQSIGNSIANAFKI